VRNIWSAIPIFAGISNEGLEILLERVKSMTVQTGEIIVKEGEPGNRLFLIEEGVVAVKKYFGTPEETELARLSRTDFFGEMCILETLPRSATVLAMETCLLHSLSSMDFYHLFRMKPAQYSILILNIARDLSRRLRHVDELFAARH
jgi:CRP/FNR family transcriptional regulator, cyclic AMP receptor protein